MLAINVAAQIVISQGGLQSQSLQQMYDTYVFIKLLTVSGFLPITFTLFTLHLIDMVSWYIMILSTSSVLLSIVTLSTNGDFDPSTAALNDLASSYHTGGPDSCGKVQPAAFCYQPSGSIYDERSYLHITDIGAIAFKMLGFCLVVLLLLAASKSRITTWQITHYLTHLITQKLAYVVRRTVVVAIYLTFSGLYLYWFSIFCLYLAKFAASGAYSKTWNFGQIVAITVWAPPLFEYIHLELRKYFVTRPNGSFITSI